MYRFIYKNYNKWTKLGIKGPKPIPVFGNAIELLNSRPQVYYNWSRTYGNIFGYNEYYFIFKLTYIIFNFK